MREHRGAGRFRCRVRSAHHPSPAPPCPRLPVFAAIRPTSWDAARDLARRLPRSAFRGQPDASQTPLTSLERAAARLQYDRPTSTPLEERMLREARRRARQYLPHVPDEDDVLGWLALLRHHGAPTRLLDFSNSFYVAVWFAIESADGDAAVWAVDLQRLREATERRLAALDPALAELPPEGWERGQGGARPPRPRRRRRRRRALPPRRAAGGAAGDVPGHRSTPRAASSTTSPPPSASTSSTFTRPPRDFGAHGDAGDALAASIVEIVLPQALHRPAREDLWRMNLTAASFFPGMDGFARSLLYYVGLHQPGEEWEKPPG